MAEQIFISFEWEDETTDDPTDRRRNMGPIAWTMPIPRQGDHVELHDRDGTYLVARTVRKVLWTFQRGHVSAKVLVRL